MPADVTVRPLQSINEAERSVWGILADVIVDCFLSILLSAFARDDGFGHHRREPDLPDLTLRRRPSK